MLHGLTTAAVLSVMTLHAAFGCCWHHEHGCCASAAVECKATGCGHSHAEGEHEHTDHDHGAGSGQPAGDGHDDECSSDRCRFVSDAAVSVPAAIDAGDWTAPEGDRPNVLIAATRTAALDQANRSASTPAPPVRALSWLCVWRL